MDPPFRDDLRKRYPDDELINHITSSSSCVDTDRIFYLSSSFIAKAYDPSEVDDAITATEVANQPFDKLHQEGKLKWAANHTPIGYPVFVVYHPGTLPDGSRGMKGRVVVDLGCRFWVFTLVSHLDAAGFIAAESENAVWDAVTRWLRIKRG
jgi:hypothetical protein